MKLATFIYNGSEQAGVFVEGQGFYPFSALIGDNAPKTMLEFIQNPAANLEELAGLAKAAPIPEADVKLCAPIPRPIRNVFCLGKNYAEHAKEVAAAHNQADVDYIPQYPVYFTKSAYPEAPGDKASIPLLGHFTQKVDYEAELAVIIGKKASRITEGQVEDVLFGYTVLNDVTAREAQQRYGQWHYGKGLDNFCPMEPHIITKDEILFPVELGIYCRVNGETRQESNTNMLIYGIPRIIAELSQGITLYPGDIIATGTPAGVGHAMSPPSYLAPGDVVECEVEKVGILTNYFVE
ncbi:MAG: fumarylacetoacetate hydrolase family protein [Eubacteriaceae bacterium]|nr:fumarylacetoacetate hydrolase family protein [Eubacteriaceae bacterium]